MPVDEITNACELCAACCKYDPMVRVRPEEIIRIEKRTGMSREEFSRNGLLAIKDDDSCIFLDKQDKIYHCSIYSDRPQGCIDFPDSNLYLHFCVPKLQEISRH